MSRDRGGPAQPLLTVRDLAKYFPARRDLLGRTTATVRSVDGISFEVMKGETLGVVGESGCGKSTTARLLMHLTAPDRGEVVFDGEGVGSAALPLRQYRRQVQMVFQDSYASLNPRLTVEASVAFGPGVHGVGRGEATRRARDLLARVATPDEAGSRLLAQAAEAMRLSARGYHRVLRVARTIAEMPAGPASPVRTMQT